MSRSKKGAPTRRNTLDRQRSLARALRPGIEPLRQLILAGKLPEPAERAFQELKLNPNDETDWKVLASAFAIHLFSDDRTRGRQAWTNFQLIHLLWEVHKRKQKN